MGGGNVIRIGRLCQVKRHQGREICALRQGRQNTVAVSSRLRACHNRRHKIGHDNRAGEMGGGMGQHSVQHIAVAQVQVPVIRTADGEGICHGRGANMLPALRLAVFFELIRDLGRADLSQLAGETGRVHPAGHVGAQRDQ